MAPAKSNPVDRLASRVRAALRKFDPDGTRLVEARSAIGAAMSLHYPASSAVPAVPAVPAGPTGTTGTAVPADRRVS